MTDATDTKAKEASGSRQGPEIYIGLITPLGAMTDELVDGLKTELLHFDYTSVVVRYSELLGSLGPPVPAYTDERTSDLIARGNELAKRHGQDAVARLGIREVLEQRRKKTGDASGETPIPRRAWILRSLKRPEEITLLRQTYGAAFFALAVHATAEGRIARLEAGLRTTRPTLTPSQARSTAASMIEQDEREIDLEYGQNVRAAFPI